MTTDAAALGTLPKPGRSLAGLVFAGQTGPVVVIVLAIVALWYAACLPMNGGLPSMPAGGTLAERYAAAWSLERPVLPSPHQILMELRVSTCGRLPEGEGWLTAFFSCEIRWSPRNLLFHGWVTLSSTLVGFGFGAALGILLAVAIVHVRSLEKSLMPWIISSQTIPILAVAPIIIVVLGSQGITGLIPKAIISAYLCFFPVTIGMVKGLNSPDVLQLDLMRTYHASQMQTLLKLRWPASVPFLFASLKVAIAISLVGAIVGELPTGAQAGLGARMLSGSYYGQTVQIWAALFAAAALAAVMVVVVGLVERVTLRLMGARR
ncbi:ABC transporter permease [Methyloraptor flagellatus]|uniref:ABC transporter permease n=1 Tax=Methyloraptor flagellatus TaxID=3162530 RepID=A0AAU7X686_9HYPH